MPVVRRFREDDPVQTIPQPAPQPAPVAPTGPAPSTQPDPIRATEEDIAAVKQPAPQAQPQPAPGGRVVSRQGAPGSGEEGGVFDEALGFMDNLLTVGSGLVGEAAGGVSGLVTGLVTGDSQAAEAVQKGVAETISVGPQTEAGKRNLTKLGGVLEPLNELIESSRKSLGDTMFEMTGSPALSTAAFILPDLAMELVGASIATRTGKNVAKNANKVRKIAKKLDSAETLRMNKGFQIKSAPNSKEILGASGNLYKEVDNIGARVRPDAYNKFADKIKKIGADVDIELNPEMARVMKLIDEKRGANLTASQVDSIRKKTVTALQKSSRSDADKRIAKMFQNEIDNLLGSAKNMDVPVGKGEAVGTRLKGARKLWARGQRTKKVETIIAQANEAKNPLAAMEQGFRKLLKDNVKTKEFSKAEAAALRSLTKPGAGVNMLKVLSTVGFDLSNPSTFNTLTTLGGGALGGTIFGPFYGIGTVLAGTGSRKLVEHILTKRGDFARAIIASGRDGVKITKAYNKMIPKSMRTPDSLGALLLSADDATLSALPKTDFIQKAVDVVKSRKRALGLGVPAAGVEVTEQIQGQ